MSLTGKGVGADLKTRAIAGAAMIAVAVGALWLGGTAFWLLASIAGLLMLAEWAGLMRAPRWKLFVSLTGLGALLVLAALTLGAGSPSAALLRAMSLAGLAAIAVALLSVSARLGWGVLYVGLPVLSVVWLRAQPDGLMLTLWTLAVVWATDIGAYFAGRAIGGPKLAPGISPSKTWAGLLGGVVGAAMVGAATASIGALPGALLLLGGLMAVLAQIGDLFESWLKRRAGVKDSGSLLPGHGGVLDRLDGVVPVAILTALLLASGAL